MTSNISSSKKYKRILQIELNEISKEVVDALISKGKLPNFAKINQEWSYLKTTSETDYEKLEPWIQWVTAHTGKTFDEHQIFRLSDVHKLKYKQIWEELSENNIESGIIGSMNIIRRNTKGGIFFPDPWAIQNETYPESLRPLWDLISSRVQGHATTKLTAADLAKGMKSCFNFNLPMSLYLKMARQIVGQKLNPKSKWKLAGIFDLFLAEIFKSVVKSTNYGYYTLFLNAIAHYQHHYWRAFDGKNFDPSITYPDIEAAHDPMTYGYEMYDKILGDILKLKDEDTLVIILSGLSQVPYTSKEAEGGMNYYRLNDHKTFAAQIGLKDGYEIFPLMSRDWQLKYENEAKRQVALKILNNLSVNNNPLFNVKENTAGFIFIETAYSKGVKQDTSIKKADGMNIGLFNDFFTNTAIKSGHHTGIGNLWISDKSVVEKQGTKVPLTSIYDFTLKALNIKSSVELKH
jgi:hypothetical protein